MFDTETKVGVGWFGGSVTTFEKDAVVSSKGCVDAPRSMAGERRRPDHQLSLQHWLQWAW